MDEHSYSSQDIKLAVMNMPRLSQRLIGIGKPYESLLLAILAIKRVGNEKFPTDKTMIQELGIKPHFFRKWLNQIYNDLLELLGDEHKPQLVINEVEHHLSWHHRDKGFYFVTRLLITPNIGDSINMNFFKPIDNFPVYYVDRVSHEIMEDKQVIRLDLKTGFYNSYVKFHEDQEEAEASEKGFFYYRDWMKKKRKE